MSSYYAVSYSPVTMAFPMAEEKPVSELRPPPINSRKYSQEWFSHRWNGHVHRQSWLLRIVYVLAGVIIMTIWIVVIFVFARIDSQLQAKNSNHDANSLISTLQNLNVKEALFFKALLRQFDPESSTLTVQWSAVTLNDDDTFSAYPHDGETGTPCGLYRDVQTIVSPELTAFIDDGTPYLTLDNTTATLPLGVLGVHSYDSVDTDIDMAAAYEGGSILKQPIFGYPLEEWSGSIVLVVTDLQLQAQYANLTSTPLNNSLFAFTFYGVNLVGSVLNWKIESFSNITADCLQSSDSCQLNISFTAKRPGIVKFVVIVVVIVNWLTTIGTDFLGVCFAGLFALPTVRSILPGAPTQFGAIIDMIGILPNIVIVSLCTVAFALTRVGLSLRQANAEREKTV